jgi:hypothetical protein
MSFPFRRAVPVELNVAAADSRALGLATGRYSQDTIRYIHIY